MTQQLLPFPEPTDLHKEAITALIQTARALAGCIKISKQLAMTYQRDLKCEVAQHYGLKFSQVNLPYEQWREIRDRYLAETEGGVK